MFFHKSWWYGQWLWLLAQVYAMPVFDMIETVLVRKFGFRPSLMLRLIARSVYVGNGSTIWTLNQSLQSELRRSENQTDELQPVRAGFTMFVAITFPFFSALLSFFGGFAFTPTMYFVSSHWSIYLFFFLFAATIVSYNILIVKCIYNQVQKCDMRVDWFMLVSGSFLVSCGSQYTNPKLSASHGLPTG